MGERKKIKKKIEGFDRVIKEHEEKVSKYIEEDGRNYALIDYWGREIERYKKAKKSEEDKLEK